jgi:hypothetical protein
MLHHTTTSPSLFSASILFLFLNKIAKLCLQLLFVCHWDLKNVVHFKEEPNTVLCMLLNSNARVEVLPDRHLCWKETHQQLFWPLIIPIVLLSRISLLLFGSILDQFFLLLLFSRSLLMGLTVRKIPV